ncbi:enoyl-CoA hydratase/isomerase family protein [Ruminococcaceae bacterium OttesenSCG-928-D13]|nr:enoyl-CoA hydratase/isomerase family protein [Ruminococcaceae bacterium OttesenSCG-928-D13]
MEYEKLLYSVNDGLCTIRLNQPDKLNALSLQSWRELAAAFTAAQADNAVCAVLLCAEGKAFSSGFDMDDSLHMNNATQWEQWQFVQEERDCAKRIWEIRKPILAAVQGFCLGSGFELSLLADLVIAADDARFGETELRFSTIPQPTLMYLIGARRAKEFFMLADRMNAEDALRVGIVNRVVPLGELEKESVHTAMRLARMPTETMQLTKRLANRIMDAQGFGLFTDWDFDLLHITRNMPTAVSTEFEHISKEQGMKAALAWMNERFK